MLISNRYGHSLVQLDPKEEAKLRRKIDLYIVPVVSLLYLFAFIDRANIGNARLAGLEKDLGMMGNDYNIVNSIFYIGYILFEIPCVMLCKYIGPGVCESSHHAPFTLLNFEESVLTEVSGSFLAQRSVLGSQV